MEAIYISPPDGDVSDGYDESDTEDANPDCLSKAVLTSRVLEVQSRGEPLLEEEVGNPEEEGEEDVQMATILHIRICLPRISSSQMKC